MGKFKQTLSKFLLRTNFSFMIRILLKFSNVAVKNITKSYFISSEKTYVDKASFIKLKFDTF